MPFGNRAVFVGNLPAGATMDMVKERLGAYGEIELAEVVEKPSSNSKFASLPQSGISDVQPQLMVSTLSRSSSSAPPRLPHLPSTPERS